VEAKKPLDKGMLWGIILIGFGALMLLQTMGIVGFVWRGIVSLGFLAGGAAFGAVYVADRRHWWSLFPAFALAAIGLLIGADIFFPWFRFGGSLFLGAIGLAFLLVWAGRQDQVWPVIPGGTLLTLAAVAGVHEIFPRFPDGSLFFLGLATTFAAVYAFAPDRRQYSWSLIVAAALFGIGLLTLGGLILKIVFPLGLILIGVYMLNGKRFMTNGR
jgi:hypothetical protein